MQTLAAPAAPSRAELARLSAPIEDLQAARRLNADLTRRQLNQSAGKPDTVKSTIIAINRRMNDSPFDWAEWSPDTPEAIADRLDEIRSTVSSLDSASPSEMNEFFDLHGFNELDLAVRDLLRGSRSTAKAAPVRPTRPIAGTAVS